MLDAGDIVWADFDPVRGSEQAGRRPALVLSPRAYNERSSRIVVCPVTSNTKSWPFKVLLPTGLRTRGAVLVDQIRALHQASRIFGLIESAPNTVLSEVQDKLISLLHIDRLQQQHTVPPDETG